MRRGRVAVTVLTAVGLAAAGPATVSGQLTRELVHDYLWPTSEQDETAAGRAFAELPDTPLDRAAMAELAGWIREGPTVSPEPGGTVHELSVATPDRARIPVLVKLPSGYSRDRAWPLLLAMHGGPPASVDGAVRGAETMLGVWEAPADTAGWIVAAPAMVGAVVAPGRTVDRLPYEIFRPEQARAVIAEVRRRFGVDPSRIVSTGISLGSNFSIAYAAAHPDWFAAIVPVSTEGESREALLRNLAPVPTYVLEGALDGNIRGIEGPRAMSRIMTRLGHDLVYRELPDRAHEGFQERYPEVLEWLASRRRPVAPREVVRVPHTGIVPTARRVHWVEADSRQALLRARVLGRDTIDATVRWATRITFHLSDDLVDLDRPIAIRVNGETVFHGRVERSARVALEEARRWRDEARVYAARVRVTVPMSEAALASARSLSEELRAVEPPLTLSYWETFAMRALEERFPAVGFDAVEAPLPAGVIPSPEQVALRVTAVDRTGPAWAAGLRPDDVLVTLGGEVFFRGRNGVEGLHAWLLRELRSRPATYQLVAFRDGRPLSMRVTYALGPYGD